MARNSFAFTLSPLPSFSSTTPLQNICRYAPSARLSHRSATYRTTPAPNITTTPEKPVVTPAPQQPPRYHVRIADDSELYTVADIRCEAFYGQPKNPHHFPVRRREIYMAMRERIRTGNKCVILLDTLPPSTWHTFCTTDGSLVVASLDVSLHDICSGLRTSFTIKANEKGKRAMYISSMAVRELWQRRGLAQRLLRYVDAMAASYGVSELFLHVEADNDVATHVYRKCGFERVDPGARAAYKWLAALANREHVIMRKVLQ